MTLRPPSDEAMRFPTEHPSCRPSCDEVRDRIDDLLDGLEPAPALASHLEDCPACAQELALARRLQEALAEGLPPLACPDEVSEAVLALAQREAASAGRRSETAESWPGRRKTGRYKDLGRRATGRFGWLEGWLGGMVWRPAMAAVVVLLLVAAPVAVWKSLDDDAPTATADTTVEPASTLDGSRTGAVSCCGRSRT